MQATRKVGRVRFIGAVEEYVGLFILEYPFIDDRSPSFDPKFVGVEIVTADESEEWVCCEGDFTNRCLGFSGSSFDFVGVF